ncbi:MAG: T9SS type A sorting domain-containing protein [Saprospiraceae bacterium]
MKKICFSLMIWSIVSFSTTVLMAQPDLEIEFQIPERIPELGDFEGFQPADMKYSPDGVNFTTCYVLRIGQNLVLRKFGSQEFAVITPNDIDDPDFDLDNYRILGFHDIVGDAETEFVLVPKSGKMGIIAVLIGMFQGNTECFNGELEALILWAHVKNLDGDPQEEIIVSFGDPSGGMVSCNVYGEGFTPGFTQAPPSEHREACMLEEFLVSNVLPPNFRWPENRSFLPEGSNDFDGDGKNDFCIIKEDSICVISGDDHSVLYSSTIPTDQFALNYIRTAYFDFCGTGQKQVMLCGSNTGNNLHDMEVIMIIDTQTGEILWSIQPYLDAGFRLNAIFTNADGLAAGIMSHQITGRVIIVAPSLMLVGGGVDSFKNRPLPAVDRSDNYTLNLIWESALPAITFMPIKRDFALEDLDLNMDGVLDIPALILQDSTSSTPVGFYVYDGTTGNAIWQTPVQLGMDPMPYFHGFFDANGDGEKELLFGAETVQTADGEIHKPFSPGFVMEYIYDMNDDGFEEILGRSPDGKIQVWSSTETSSVIEARFNALGEIAVSPNPSSGHFTLTWQQPNAGETSFELYDERGAKVYSSQLGNIAAGNVEQNIQLTAHLSNGLYLGRICSGNACSSVFLALQR